MALRITILSENTARADDLLGEWGLCHCTDLPAISVLARGFGDRFIFNKSGTVIDLA